MIISRIRVFPILVCCLLGFSTAFTIYNRFASTYFWNRSGKVQVFLLIVLSSILAFLAYLLTNHLLQKSQIRPTTRRFVFIALVLGLIWVFLPFAENLYKGEFRTPENDHLYKHQLQISATGKNNPLSNGNEVRIKNIELRDTEGGVNIFNLMSHNNLWTVQNQELATEGADGASISYDFISRKEKSQLNVIFAVSPSSGSVVVSLDGDERSLDLYEQQDGETLFSVTIPSNRGILFKIIFFRLLETISVIAIFRLKNNKFIFLTLFSIYSIFLLHTIWKAPITKRGDGYEYLYMTQAFQNHANPNPIDSDIPSLYTLLSQNKLHIPSTPFPGFTDSKLGIRFCNHFWAYSLIVVPTKILLEKLGLNGLLSFQLTNTFLYLLSLWGFLLWGNLRDDLKRLLAAFLAINPVLWYLTWWHPEVFTFSFVVLSLTFLTRKNYKLATFFAAVASMQNQPLIFLTGYFIFLDLRQFWPKISLIIFIKSSLPALPSFIPGAFFYYFYGTPNLILSNNTSLELITFKKFTSYFLDLNIGFLPYMPILLLFFIIVIIKFVLDKNVKEILFTCTLFIIILSTTQIDNWNSDSAGLMRYGVWVIPLMAFYTVSSIKWDGVWQNVWIGGIIYQLFVIMFFGGINANINYVQMTPIAQVVLNYAPHLYSPEKEVFMERANHMERTVENDFKFSFYTSQDGKIKKILTDYEHFKKFRTLQYTAFQVTDNNALDKAELFLANKEGLHYLNFSNDEIQITNFEKLSETFID